VVTERQLAKWARQVGQLHTLLKATVGSVVKAVGKVVINGMCPRIKGRVSGTPLPRIG
jgi:hypothetical protein